MARNMHWQLVMSKKILIAGNNMGSSTIIKLLIEDFGYKTITAANGNKALEIVKQVAPDVILIDISVLGSDGLTAIEIIKSTAILSKIPIFVVTSKGYSLAYKAIKAGCNEVINKPLDLAKLEPLLTEYLPPVRQGERD
jgi:CheY-like chemotaxis protein